MSTLDTSVHHISDSINSLFGNASVGSVYGEVLHENGTTIVPASEVFSAGGFGLSVGESDSAENGAGGGGGGMIQSRPVAVIIIDKAGNVRVDPIIDHAKIALAFFTTVGFAFSMVSKFKRARLRRANI